MPCETPLLQTDIPGIPVRRGKVRDILDLGDRIHLVATDRISAYDVVMPTGIPGKGVMLTRISRFWFDFFADTTKHHLIDLLAPGSIPTLDPYLSQLAGRTMICRKVRIVPIECVVRGYLAGSGWQEYQQTGAVCGVPLSPGLRQCDRLPEPIFTPALKNDVGHDENVTFEQAAARAGTEVMCMLRDRSLDLYRRAADYALSRGLIIADTKFEFGEADGELLLADEVLTPDSSRFWPADAYEPGRDQESFDKQYLRNYLQDLCATGRWNKQAPGPDLPPEVVAHTSEKYRRACTLLCGV